MVSVTNMKKIIDAINDKSIIKVLKDILILEGDLKKIGNKATPGIAGLYGELLAWKKLRDIFKKKECEVSFGSGQSKADLVIKKGSKKINIEVKTSRLKEEQPGTVYGFAINIKKCSKKEHKNVIYNHPKKGKIEGDFCYFDYLFIVTLSEDLSKPRFYIFPRKFLEKNEKQLRNRSKRFSSGSHRIIFVEKMKDAQEITNQDKWIKKNKKKFENNWNSIKI